VILFHELDQLRPADFVATHLGHQVALDQLGRAHVLLDEFEEITVRLATLEQLQHRHIQPFFKHVTGVSPERAAADVHGMACIGKQCDQLTATEDRGDYGEVVEMAGG
jgi:hypothetical protein